MLTVVLSFAEGNQVKVYHIPSEVKATTAERLLKQALNGTDLDKSLRAECLPVAKWMESVISIMLGTKNWGLFSATTAQGGCDPL